MFNNCVYCCIIFSMLPPWDWLDQLVFVTAQSCCSMFWGLVWFGETSVKTCKKLWPLPREKSRLRTDRFKSHVPSRSNATPQHLQRDEIDACQSKRSRGVSSHSEHSRTPLTSSQLHSIRVEKLWDRSESSKSYCPAKISQRAKNKNPSWSLLHHSGVGSIFLSLALASVHVSTIKKKVEKNCDLWQHIKTKKPLLTGKKVEASQGAPRWSLKGKNLLPYNGIPAVCGRKTDDSFTQRCMLYSQFNRRQCQHIWIHQALSIKPTRKGCERTYRSQKLWNRSGFSWLARLFCSWCFWFK